MRAARGLLIFSVPSYAELASVSQGKTIQSFFFLVRHEKSGRIRLCVVR